jgi:hypothetical protein
MQGEYDGMGELNYFLRLHIKQLQIVIFINQSRCSKDLLKRFEIENPIENAKPFGTLMSMNEATQR